MNNKPLILLVGPSDSGKTTIADILEKEHGMKQLRSYTTRKPRFDGEDGHIFVSDEEFDKLEDIIAYTEFDGHRYCATAQQANEADVYVIDPRGVREMDRSKIDRQIIVVGLTAPADVRMLRMLQRGDDTSSIIKRVNNDKNEFDGYVALCDCMVNAYEGSTPESIANDILNETSSVICKKYLYSRYPLSACPFCGGDGGFILFGSSENQYHAYVSCIECEASTATISEKTEEEALKTAVELWNRRHKEE